MSAAHQHLDLVPLLRGELSNRDVLAAEDHLAGCGPCRDELVATVAGHALLTRGSSVLPGLPTGTDPVTVPPLALGPAGRRTRFPLVVAAAVAVLVAGAGLGGAAVRALGDDPTSRPSQPAPRVTASAVLEPVEGPGAGEVVMTAAGDHSTRMTLTTTALPEAPAGDFYYVWLLDPGTNKMLPLGLVGPGGTTSFRLDERLLASYSAVDVSLEADDGDPGHSVTSVLRGTYQA